MSGQVRPEPGDKGGKGMDKVDWKPGTMIYPLPAVMVSLGETPDEYTIITIAWTGTLCTDPPLCYISVRPERHSHAILRRTGEFVINLTTVPLAAGFEGVDEQAHAPLQHECASEGEQVEDGVDASGQGYREAGGGGGVGQRAGT